MIIKGKKNDYKVTIGLETHTELNTKTKLFSQSKNEFASPQNKNVCLFDIATPGKLPVLNQAVVDKAILFGLAINAEINKKSRFDRKHYFYPDLPQGYQITQFYSPIIRNGSLKIHLDDGKEKNIRIRETHIEQDAGKLIHDRYANNSCIDYNRSGVPLLEIVTEPDFEDPKEVVSYLKTIQAILRSINVSLADLEKGTFRCDVNISVSPVNSDELGTRCEVKNINSFRFIAEAINFEAKRQVELIENNVELVQQTRLFNSKTGETELMRDKADAIDYYYFADPDLLPISITDEYIEKIKQTLPELPEQKAERYRNIGLSQKEIDLLVQNTEYSEYFDALIKKHDAKLSSTWMLTELFGIIGKLQKTLKNCGVTAEKLIDLIDNLKDGTISGKIAKVVLIDMIETGETASEIINKKGLKQIDDVEAISKVIDEVIKENQTQVEQYKNGNEKIFSFFVGLTLKKMSGKANPVLVNKLLKEKIK